MANRYNGTLRTDVQSLSKNKKVKKNIQVKDTGISTEEYSSRALSLSSRLKSLESALAGSIYSFFINLNIGNTLMTPFTEDNFTVSLSHKKNGTGKANAFTLQLAYKPTNNNTSGKGSINYIDHTLFTSGGKCKFQYGYGDSFLSPVYEGMITKYNEEIQEGILHYTITGYSSVVTLSEDVIDVVPVVKFKRATEVAYEALAEKLKGTGYTAAIDKAAQGTDSEIEVPGCPDTHLFPYVQSVLDLAYNKENENRKEHEQITYSYVIDDSSKKVVIVKLDPSDKSSSTMFTFEWMTRTNSLVQNFSFDYDGYIAMAYGNSSESNQENESLGVGIDSAGNPVKKSSVKSTTTTGDLTNKDYVQEKSRWSKAIMELCYGATLTLVGIPFEIPITTVVRVIPLINGVEHLTAGYYRVLGCEDTIDINGYSTVLDLTRIPIRS